MKIGHRVKVKGYGKMVARWGTEYAMAQYYDCQDWVVGMQGTIIEFSKFGMIKVFFTPDFQATFTRHQLRRSVSCWRRIILFLNPNQNKMENSTATAPGTQRHDAVHSVSAKKSRGERRVRIDFNMPSENPGSQAIVAEIKRKGAELINLIDQITPRAGLDGEDTGEFLRLKSLALTDIESGTAWGVKAVTF